MIVASSWDFFELITKTNVLCGDRNGRLEKTVDGMVDFFVWQEKNLGIDFHIIRSGENNKRDRFLIPQHLVEPLSHRTHGLLHGKVMERRHKRNLEKNNQQTNK